MWMCAPSITPLRKSLLYSLTNKPLIRHSSCMGLLFYGIKKRCGKTHINPCIFT